MSVSCPLLTVENLWPIIYKPHFTIANTPTPLLNAMLCVAACVVPTSERDRYDSETLFETAKQSVKDCWSQPQIETVQSILLLSLRQTGCGDKHSAFGFAAQACTLALSLGLNNAIPRDTNNGEVRNGLIIKLIDHSPHRASHRSVQECGGAVT